MSSIQKNQNDQREALGWAGGFGAMIGGALIGGPVGLMVGTGFCVGIVSGMYYASS